MKKILHIIPGFGGGISSFVKNLALGNSGAEIVYDVMGFNKFPQSYEEIINNQGGKCYSLPSVHKHPIKMMKIYNEMLKKQSYDVVHCHFSGYRGFAFKAIAKIHGVNNIATHAHRTSEEKSNIFDGVTRKLSQLLSRSMSSELYACSKMAGEYIFGSMQLKNKKVIVIPNSVDTEKFLKDVDKSIIEQYRKEFEIPINCEVIGHIGRFNIQKNHIFMLKLAKNLKERNVNFRMIFVGDGELLEKIKIEAQKMQLCENVIFAGKREDIDSFIKLFDVMILPSLFEGLPTVAVEAQAAGIPCVLADTITEECDLRMGLVEFLPITKVTVWSDELKKIVKKNVDPSIRKKQLELTGFTIDSMQKKYRESLGIGG